MADKCQLEPCIAAWVQMVRTYHKMQRRVHLQLSKYNLTLPQFEVLLVLNFSEGITQQELAERLLVTKGNVCGLIDRLTTGGLVERRDDPEDRRVNRLHVTEAGKKLAEEVIPEHYTVLREMMAPIGEDEQRTLVLLLSQLEQGLPPE